MNDWKPIVTEGIMQISISDFVWLDNMAKKAQKLEWDYQELLGQYEKLEKEMAQQQGGNL